MEKKTLSLSLEKPKKMELSAYELEREANIQRNRAVLDSLGLGDGSSLKPFSHAAPKSAPPPRKIQEVSCEPSRRSNRVSKKTPLFTGLTDAFFKAEENDMEVRELPAAVDRPRRSSNQTKRFEDEFGYGDVKPRNKAPRASVDTMSATSDWTSDWTMPLIPTIVRAATTVENASALVPGQAEQGSRGWFFKCPLCDQQWSLRCDGRTLQKHNPCGSVRIF
jgi:hypothetical protein